MKKQYLTKFFAALSLLVVAMLVLVPAAYAFDGRGGDRVVIGAGEVVNDDLYVGGQEVVIDGTIKGDLVAAGRTVIVNGIVEGDVLAAAQSVVINGQVLDDVRIAGAALILGSEAQIGGDVVAASYSLETGSASRIGGDLYYGGYQALLAGEIIEDVGAGVNRLELNGKVGGDVQVAVDVRSNAPQYSPFTGIPDMPSIPVVASGLTLGQGAEISGDLNYTAQEKLSLPVEKINGQVNFTLQEIDKALEDIDRPATTPVNPAVSWLLDNLRRFIALVLTGLLLAWLVPALLTNPAARLQSKPAASLGWGTVTFVLFPFIFLVLTGVVIALALLFTALTLGNMTGSVVWLGIAFLITLGVVFGLIVSYLTKLVVAYLGGRWILSRIKPEWNEKPFWPVLVGVVVVAALLAIPLAGWLFNLVITLLGLGALWLLVSDRLQAKRLPAAETPTVEAQAPSLPGG